MFDYKKENIFVEQVKEACPEIYEVYLNNKKIGQLRLTRGYFEAYLDKPVKVVYDAMLEDSYLALVDGDRNWYISKGIQHLIYFHYLENEPVSNVEYKISYYKDRMKKL